MNMDIDNYAYLCGYFFVDRNCMGIPSDVSDFWVQCEYDGAGKQLLSNFYYPEFVEFCTEYSTRYRLGINSDVSVPLNDGSGECTFHVDDITLGIYPHGVVIFSIGTAFSGTSEEHVIETLGKLRSCCFYDETVMKDFLGTVIEPLKRIYKAFGFEIPSEGASCPYLVETGNKFKIFQIAHWNGSPVGQEETDRRLFGLGTLSNYYPDKMFSSSLEYYEKLMGQGKLSVFNNWKALMLLDTVTFISLDVSDYQLGIWKDDYFGKIYLYELYRKTYLYRQNLLFRKGVTSAEKLQKELKEFERKYTFSVISYNFLPNEIDSKIGANLEFKREMEDVYHAIEQDVKAIESEREGRVNKFLTFLTIMASLSAVWDISSMVEMLVDYEHTLPSVYTGYRVTASLLIAVILIVALVSNRKKSK